MRKASMWLPWLFARPGGGDGELGPMGAAPPSHARLGVGDMDIVLKTIGILAIPVVWGLVTARLIEWLRDRRQGPGCPPGDG